VPTPEDRQAAERARRPVRVALAFLVCVVIGLVAAAAFAGYRIYSLGNHRFVDQAGPFFAVTEDLAVEMLNQETAVRGYLITADPSTLAPYRQGKKYTNLELALIAKDASFDPAIPSHLAAMRRDVSALQSYFAREIALVKSGPAGQRRAQAEILAGKTHFDHLRGSSRALINDASNVIKRSHRAQRRTLVIWWLILGVAGAAAVAIAVVLLLRVPRRLYQLFREERFARRDAEQSADASRALAHVREAVVLLDEAGTVRYSNPTAEKLFGLPLQGESESLRHALDEFHTAGEHAGARPLVLEGRERWLTCVESKFAGGRVVVFRDVSDDHRLEQLRSDFVATAAHELRTPLAAIYGAVRTLRQDTYELPQTLGEQFLEMIEKESDRLKLVTDQLVVSAQLDAADLHLQPRPVDAFELSVEILEAARLRTPTDIELAVDKPDHPVSLEADPDRLRQVIANLIDNAIKYSPGGGRIHLRAFASGPSGVIEVADQGLGIPTDELQRIFDKFYRLDPDMTGGVGGSGLGLYISRELVRQMGGELSVTSQLGSGSTFRVTLPLARPLEEAHRPREGSSLAGPV
jgi:signal transduction histidine kinase